MLHAHLFHHLQLSIKHNSIRLTQQSHALSITLNNNHPILISKLISSYSHFNLPSFSRQIFESLCHKNPPNALVWNSLLSSYCNNHLLDEPISLFRPCLDTTSTCSLLKKPAGSLNFVSKQGLNRMRALVSPDNYTLAIVYKVSTEVGDLEVGCGIHFLAVKLGFCWDAVVCNSIIRFYSKCGDLGDARKVFNEMPVRSVASWNSMIAEYAKLEYGEEEVWKLVKAMQVEGMKLDGFTVCTIIPLCWSAIRVKEINGYIVRKNLSLYLDFHVGSSLVSAYSKGKRVDIARRVFDRMVFKNVVVWTAMLNGCVDNGEFEEALELLRVMQLKDGILPIEVSLVSVLPAIGSLARLLEGKQVHAFAIRMELNCESSLNNALIDMYSKRGRLDSAKCIFDDKTWHKDAISWSSMICCYGLHGMGEEAVMLFNRLCSNGVNPDHITVVGVLSACSRAGLVSEGFEIFNSLVKNYGVVPTVEICSCMVDMLGRADRLPEALDFIHSMTCIPGPSVWGALFGSPSIHKHPAIQDVAYKALLQLERENPSNYVSISNLHASFGRWDAVAKVRKIMKEKGLKKMPGCSWISVYGVDYSFYSSFVADQFHHCSDALYVVLDNLLLAMKGVGSTPSLENSL